MERLRIYESLYILATTHQQINHQIATLVQLNLAERPLEVLRPREKAQYLTIFYMAIITACSFLEEYDENFEQLAEPKFKQRIIEVKKIAGPARNKINRDGMRTFRNEIIAHPNRIDNSTKDFSVPKLGTYDTPANYNDLRILRSYITMIDSIIEAEFCEYYRNINKFMDGIEIPTIIRTYDHIARVNYAVIDRINYLAREKYGRTYQLSFPFFAEIL